MPRPSQRSQTQHSQRNTQLTLEESFQEVNQNIEEQVSDLVRYIVNKAGDHSTFKRTDLKKHVLSKAGQNFQTIIDKASTILRNVYGYNMIPCDGTQTAVKSYIVSNSLPYLKDPIQQKEDSHSEYPKDAHRILLLLILSHIFMSNNAVSEASLYSFLQTFNISIERGHEIFGNVKDYIFNTLKLKKYIEIETDQMSKKMTFSWGPRAENEISKHDILNFVCKMYKDRMPTAWVNQYRIAEEQEFKNDKD